MPSDGATTHNTAKSLRTALFRSVALASTLLGAPALAEGTFTLGGFATNDASPYVGSDNDEWHLVPFISYETERFSVGLGGLSYRLINNDETTVSVGVASSFGEIFDEGVTLFDGLERDADLQVVLEYGHDFGGLFVEGSTSVDISDAGSGLTSRAAVGYGTEVGFASLSVSGGVTYNSDEHNQYYYGVAVDEVAAGRPLYLADDAILPFASVEVVVPVADNTVLVGQLEAIDYRELEDSPLIDTDITTSAVIGIIYQF